MPEPAMPDLAMPEDLLAFVREQKDRADILACLHRYTRGVDRFDRELMLSAYWPDAIDEHGVAEGIASDFVDWAIGWHGEFQTRHQHIVTNHTVEFAGATAHGETYFLFWGENRDGPPTLAFGRYIDRYEKRGGEWRIAHRVCINEKVGSWSELPMTEKFAAAIATTGPNQRDSSDVSYLRPLTRNRAT